MKIVLLALLFPLSSVWGEEIHDPFSPDPQKDPFSEVEVAVVDLSGSEYSEKVSRANKAVLRQASEKALGPFGETSLMIRLTICPTFGRPLILRVYQRDGLNYLAVKRLSGVGGYELGHIELQGEIAVSAAALEALVKKVSSAKLTPLFEMSAEEKSVLTTYDGVSWTLEVRIDRKLRVIDFQSGGSLVSIYREISEAKKVNPEITDDDLDAWIELVDLCKIMFQLAGLDEAHIVAE